MLADPPYAVTNASWPWCWTGWRSGWLAGHGVLVLERAARDGEPDWPDGLTDVRSRRYGDTATHWIGWAARVVRAFVMAPDRVTRDHGASSCLRVRLLRSGT